MLLLMLSLIICFFASKTSNNPALTETWCSSMCCLLCSLTDSSCLESRFVSILVHSGCFRIHDALLCDILTLEWFCIIGLFGGSHLCCDLLLFLLTHIRCVVILYLFCIHIEWILPQVPHLYATLFVHVKYTTYTIYFIKSLAVLSYVNDIFILP